MDKKFGIKHVVAMGIGTALFVVLTNVQIPVGFIPNTALHEDLRRQRPSRGCSSPTAR